MAKFNKIKVMSEALSTGVVPVFYHPSVEVSKSVLKACYDGGIRVFEFTNRGDFAHEIFVELSKYAAAELPEMVLGAGSFLAGRGQFHSRSSLQSGDRTRLQSPLCTLHSRMRERQRDWPESRGRLRYVQGLSRRCAGPGIREGSQGSDAVDAGSGYGWRKARVCQSGIVVQGRRVRSGNGQQSVSEGGNRAAGLAVDKNEVQRVSADD